MPRPIISKQNSLSELPDTGSEQKDQSFSIYLTVLIKKFKPKIFSSAPLIVIESSVWPELVLCILVLSLAGISLFQWFHYRAIKREEMEQLRQRIAQDFHDEMGSRLSIITMYSELVKGQVEKDNTTARRYLDKISAASDSLYGAMKDLLWVLHPGRDRLEDLLIKVKDFGEDLFSDTPLVLQTEGLQQVNGRLPLSLDHKRHVLLIVKEAMHNALKHSGGTLIKLKVEQRPYSLILSISDNGRGFDIATVNKGEGLKNMETRARQINARWKLTSGKNGTQIELHVPYS